MIELQSRRQAYNLRASLTGGAERLPEQASSASSVQGEELTGALSSAASVTLTTATDLFVVLVIGLYFALQPGLYQSGLLRLVPPARQKQVAQITEQVAHAIRRWLAGRVISMAVVGLWLLGIAFALLLGLIAGLWTFVPYLGAILSAVPALLIAALYDYHALVYVGALNLGLHIVEGYVLAPLIQNQAVSIAPGFLLTAQALGAAVAGVMGIALAAPITLVLSVVIQLTYVRDVIAEAPHLPGFTSRDQQGR